MAIHITGTVALILLSIVLPLLLSIFVAFQLLAVVSTCFLRSYTLTTFTTISFVCVAIIFIIIVDTHNSS